MTIQDRLQTNASSAESRGYDLDLLPIARKPSLMERVRLFVLRRRINAMLRRTVGPVHYEEAGKLPAYLLRDIGITPPM